MEIVADRFFDQSKFASTIAIVRMNLEQFLANNILREDGSRIFYASKSWAFRQRINLLNMNSSPDYSSLNFPFCAYYRNGNWTVGPEVAPGVPAADAAILGTTDLGPNVRFFNAQFPFSVVFFFNREDDAQLAYEALMWIKHPRPIQTTAPGLVYKDTAIDIPIRYKIEDIQFAPEYKEKNWLEMNRVFPIEVSLKVDSVIIRAQPQTPNALYPTDDDTIYITKKVILDFLSFKNDMLVDSDGVQEILLGSFIPDPDLNGTFTAGVSTDTSVTLHWTYNPLCTALYEPNVTILCNNGTSVQVPKTALTATISGLNLGSTYTFKIQFFALSGAINQYSVTALTTGSQSNLNLKGMIGYTW